MFWDSSSFSSPVSCRTFLFLYVCLCCLNSLEEKLRDTYFARYNNPDDKKILLQCNYMTTLIKNALIYDGSGSDAVSADILIRGKRIAKIGTFSRDHADVCIDAHERIVMPGFIDVSVDTNTHLSLLHDPLQENFLREGITTIIGGGEGVAPAPVFHNSLSVLRKHSAFRPTNVNWFSLSTFFEHLERQGIGINVGYVVGYTTIRNGMIGNHREISSKEIHAMQNVLTQAFHEGAFGVSVKLDGGIAARVSHAELAALGIVVAKTNRVFAIHPRDNVGNMYETVKNIISLAQETNANIELNHLLPLAHVTKDYVALTELLSLKSALSNIHFDVPVHRMHEIPVHVLLPVWAHESHIEETLKSLRTREVQERVLNYLRNELEERDLVFCRGAHPHLGHLEGERISDIAASRGKSASSLLLELMLTSSLRGTVIDEAIDIQTFQKLITHPHAIFSSNPLPHKPGSLRTFLKQVRDKGWCSFGSAVQKFSGAPAQKYNISNRGLIRSGYYADIVILDDLCAKDVFVNGEHVIKQGRLHTHRAGILLRASK